MLKNIIEMNLREINEISGGFELQISDLSARAKAFLDTALINVIFIGSGTLTALVTTYYGVRKEVVTALTPLVGLGAGLIAFWAVPQMSQYINSVPLTNTTKTEL